jgi:hypothetical protein
MTDGLTPLTVPLFDVPADARDLRLVPRNNDAETALIIGHENSLLHGKTTFALAKASGA